jgi:hypothetical protein
MLVCPSLPAGEPNLLPNGDFKKQMEGWSADASGTAEGECKITDEGPNEGEKALMVKVTTAGSNWWDVNVKLLGLAFVKDTKYIFRFVAKGEPGPAPILLMFESDDGTQHRTLARKKELRLQEGWNEYEYEFVAEDSAPKARIYFGNMNRTATTYWIANASLTVEP